MFKAEIVKISAHPLKRLCVGAIALMQQMQPDNTAGFTVEL
jgi:hypothetical protein